MKRNGAGEIIYSPTDLCIFLGSPFASWMDRYRLFDPELEPDTSSEEQALLAAHGDAHELRILEKLKREGRRVVEINRKLAFPAAHEITLDAMQQGVEIIYQGALRHDGFEGWSDFLIKVDRASPRLGAHRYEPVDTKLARKAKPYFLLQLSAYADMLEGSQGVRPDAITIITGTGESLRFRTDDVFFCYRAIKAAFLEAQARFDPASRPIPDGRADHGRWQSHADDILESIDHLSRVAGVTAHQVKHLEAAGVATMNALAKATLRHVARIEDTVVERLKAQARLQIASAALGRPAFELLAHAPGVRQGLAVLPPERPLDVFFDMEGYPLFEDGAGLEYLFGASSFEDRHLQYQDFWGHDRVSEKLAFEAFVDAVWDRFQRDPTIHVFHYGTYEISALRHLMGRHGTREERLDDLLRAEVFVDLLRVVRQGVRVGEPSYSLKNIERLYRTKRTEEVASAGASIVAYAGWREAPDGPTPETSAVLRSIRDYNEADCASTAELVLWLRTEQAKAQIAWVPPPEKKAGKGKRKNARDPGAPEGAPVRRPDEVLSDEMLAIVPHDRSQDPERWRIHELLAHLVTFHRREAKPEWWTYYDRLAMTEEELIEDPDCLGGLERIDAPPEKDKRSLVYAYRFDADQETSIAAGDVCDIVGEDAVIIHAIDRDLGRIGLRRGASRPAPPSRLSLVPNDHVGAEVIAESVARIAKTWIREHTLPPALNDFLRRHPPKIRGQERGSAVLGGREHEELVDRVVDVVSRLDGTTLAIQGPPGSGKSFTGARAIVELLREGFRVGITSNSHAVIDELMMTALEEASARGLSFRSARVISAERETVLPEDVRRVEKMDHVIHIGPTRDLLVGATAWGFSHPSAEGAFDFLFIDEAGQVSLANVAGMMPSAKNVVLIGDQRQLSQPVKGAHPGESGQSALQYLLEEHATIPETLGVFLSETRRLHPSICSFISGAFYDGRLLPHRETRERRIVVPQSGGTCVTVDSGLVFVPALHEGNSRASDEEVEVIRGLVAELLGRHVEDPKNPRELALEDILIVAPYNMQVRALKAALPGARVGTVDKFQGQEAPVVIVSMCASTAESSARGMRFLFSPNRLNVAISRAQCLAIVVGSPALARARAKSIEEIKLANGFCRLVEEAGGAVARCADHRRVS